MYKALTRGAALTYPDNLVFCAGREMFPVWTEANTPDVQIAVLGKAIVLQVTDLLASLNIKDLSRAVATSSDISAVSAEAHTAYHTRMRQVVH